MSTQASLLGFSSWTVDAISWTPILTSYAWRPDAEVTLENQGSVTVNLRTLDSDSAHERPLLSGESLNLKSGGPRAQGRAPAVPICYAKAVSGTATLRVIEQ